MTQDMFNFMQAEFTEIITLNKSILGRSFLSLTREQVHTFICLLFSKFTLKGIASLRFCVQWTEQEDCFRVWHEPYHGFHQCKLHFPRLTSLFFFFWFSNRNYCVILCFVHIITPPDYIEFSFISSINTFNFFYQLIVFLLILLATSTVIPLQKESTEFIKLMIFIVRF